MNEKQIQALIKKIQSKPKKQDVRPTYDPTLEATRREAPTEESEARSQFFSEMKKREF
ncbi:MAG: hypothetical protein HY275_11965 [Gemmatimonadetes bacterium]|nr:hypothetical protein [Gemmatimonadota bacterium]